MPDEADAAVPEPERLRSPWYYAHPTSPPKPDSGEWWGVWNAGDVLPITAVRGEGWARFLVDVLTALDDSRFARQHTPRVAESPAEQINLMAAELGAKLAVIRRDYSDLQKQKKRIEVLTTALRDLLADSQHTQHPDCEDGPCPVRQARAVLTEPEE